VQDRSLVVFGDYVCPFCFLAESGVARLRSEHGVRVESAAFELRPPGTPLPAPDERWMRDAWAGTVEPLARELGVTMRYPAFTTRTRKAHEAVAFARSQAAAEPMHEAVYRAYWQDGRDIGRIDVLTEIAGEVGLDRGGLRVALDIDQWTERVLQDTAWAAQLRLAGVPAYLLRGSGGDEDPALPVAAEVRTGLQRYDDLRAWVVRDDV
jgi:predicted DsbA family dithiol-disulfide isomerase